MHAVIPIYKPIGQTPLQAILDFKKHNPEYLTEKISYAGRLDPMAEGLLLLLIGEENKKRKEYESLRKTYEFTVLLGVETDTYDMLGKAQNTQSTQQIRKSDFQNIRQSEITDKPSFPSILRNDIRISNLLSSFVGKQTQAYPPYSSKAVNGKPLYWWARTNKLNEIEIPTKEIEIYDLQLISSREIKIRDLRLRIHENIKKAKGNFRQEEILKIWEDFFTSLDYSSNEMRSSRDARTVESFPIFNCKITCSSGTYVRSIAHEIGQKLGTGAIALSIKRSSIGSFNISSIINI